MTTEEVASVFGEMLVFQSMLNNAKTDNEKIALLAMKVNDMINTAIRQIAFHFLKQGRITSVKRRAARRTAERNLAGRDESKLGAVGRGR